MQSIFQLLDGNCEIDQTGRTSRHSGFQVLGELTRKEMDQSMVPTEVQFAPTTDVGQTLHILHGEHDPPFPPGTCGTPPHLVFSIALSRAYDRNFAQNDQLSLHRENPLCKQQRKPTISPPHIQSWTLRWKALCNLSITLQAMRKRLLDGLCTPLLA